MMERCFFHEKITEQNLMKFGNGSVIFKFSPKDTLTHGTQLVFHKTKAA